MNRSIYIAGPMAGDEHYKWRFGEAEKRLHAAGWIVLNPAWMPLGLREHAYMPICLAMLQAADAVVMLDGWQGSRGAQVEREFAGYQGKRIYYGLMEACEA